MRAVRIVLCSLMFPSALVAQMLEVQPGARVRVRADGALAGRLTGVVVARTADSLTIARSNAAPLAVPMSRLTSVELSRGKSHSAGAIKGLLIGAVLGLGFGFTPVPEPTCTRGTCDAELTRAEFIGTSVLGSGVLGAGIGAIVGIERWDRYLMPARVGITAPSRGQGIGLALGYVYGGKRSGS